MKIPLKNNKKINKIINKFFKSINASIQDPTEEFAMKDAIVDLLCENEGNNLVNLINNVTIDNADCLYSGKVYRKLYFDSSFIENLNSYEDIETNEYFDGNEFLAEIKKRIRTGDYQSASKSYEACLNLTENDLMPIYTEEAIGVIIEFECKNGIDMMKLTNKYSEIFFEYCCEDPDSHSYYEKYEAYNKELKKLFNSFKNEEEIYAQLPNNYKIINVAGLDIDEIENCTVSMAMLCLE